MREEPKDLWVYEREAFAEGYQAVCGVDEAGRGPLAGPVCAAAVILPAGLVIDGLNDSKKLTDKKRRELYDVITQNAVSYGIAMASEREIDEINILQATFLAMQRRWTSWMSGLIWRSSTETARRTLDCQSERS